jgi:hypothetical protein
MWMMPANKPADATAVVPHVRKFMLKLFHSKNAASADWPLIVEALLVAALEIIDQDPDDPNFPALLHRVNSASFRRLSGNAVAGGLLSQQNPPPEGVHPATSEEM